MIKNPYKQYQKTSVTTANKGKVLLMLYEGAIKFVRQAQSKMENQDIAAKGLLISKATAILSELMNTLDFEVGGQLAIDLENLYIFMIDHLIEANIHNDVEKLKSVERILKTLYTAWSDVVNNPQPDKKVDQAAQGDGQKGPSSAEKSKEAVKNSSDNPVGQSINFSA